MKRKIALISEHASPLAVPGGVDNGGQNVYVAQVARQLAALGHDVDVFTRRDRKSLPKIVQWKNGVRVIHVPAGPAEYIPKENLLWTMEKFTQFMIRYINQQEKLYDLIHANFWMSGLVAADLKRALGIPFVITFHALGRVRRLFQGKEDGFPDSRFSIEDRIIAEADRIIAECPQDEQDLRDLYHADQARIVVVPCGFNPDELWPVDKGIARRFLRLPDEEKIVLQLGRMVPRKGVDTAIRGFSLFQKQHPMPARLVIVGGETHDPDPVKTPELGRLEKIAVEEGIRDKVCFIGRRERRLLKYFYSAADVLISTPWYEPFGITPLESMACGTPVIGAAVGGIKYSVIDGETGFLITPNNPDILGKRLTQLFEQPSLTQCMRTAGIQRVNGQFTWMHVADALERVYETVIAARQYSSYSQIHHLGLIHASFEAAVETISRSQALLGNQILEVSRAIFDCFSRGNKVLVGGNGGSAADAQHFAAELVGRFINRTRPGLPVISLNADTAIITAWANDNGYDEVFNRQIEAYGQPGDIIIGISTSGKSRNLIEAFNKAQQQGLQRIALVGHDGGELRSHADTAIIVPSTETQRIQETQILILHVICEEIERLWVENSAFNQPALASTRGSWKLDPSTPVTIAFDQTE